MLQTSPSTINIETTTLNQESNPKS